MGLLDQLLNQVTGAGQPSPAGAALQGLGIDPQHAGLAQAVLGMLSDENGPGLGGIQQKFQQAGLGDVIGSWIATGQNLPVDAQQLEGALGGPLLQQLAQKAGLNAQSVGPILVQLLPLLIDKLTPQGHVPQQGNLLQAALEMLGGRR